MTDPSILQDAARLAVPFIPLLASACIRVSILLAVAFGAVWLIRGASSKLKHILWMSAIGGSFFVLALSLTGPLFHLTLPHAMPDSRGPLAAFSSALLPAASTFGVSGGMPPLAAQMWRQLSVRHDWISLWPSVVLLAWIAGAMSGWLRLLWGRLRLLNLARRNTTSAGRYDRMVRTLSRRVGIRRMVRVVESSGCVSPLTRGILHPVIFLPPSMRGWSAAARQSVLLHELRHIRRGDSFSLAIAYVMCSFLWFVPPVWAAYSRLYLEQEKACDAAVIESGVGRSDYATCVLNAAQLCREPALLAGLSFSGRRKKILKDRIHAIVDTTSMKRNVALFGLAALAMGAALLLGAAGEDPGRKYGHLYLTEYQVRSAEEARILNTLIQYENAFNVHDERGLLSLFAEDALYMPCGWYTKFPVASADCMHIIQRNFSIFGFETFYDPSITVRGTSGVVQLLLESGPYLTDYTFVMKKVGLDWLVSDAFYRNNRVKS